MSKLGDIEVKRPSKETVDKAQILFKNYEYRGWDAGIDPQAMYGVLVVLLATEHPTVFIDQILTLDLQLAVRGFTIDPIVAKAINRYTDQWFKQNDLVIH